MPIETKLDITKREITVEAVSKKNNSLKSKDGNWYNINPKLSDDVEKAAVDMIQKIGKGDIVELTADFPKRIFNVIVIKKKSEKKSNWQEDMIDFEELLSDLHKKFKNITLKTEKIEVDLKEKYALFKATVTADKLYFEAHGDSTKENIESTFVQPHFIRMAETRAICRALRFITNNAACSEEETKKGEDSLDKDNHG